MKQTENPQNNICIAYAFTEMLALSLWYRIPDLSVRIVLHAHSGLPYRYNRYKYSARDSKHVLQKVMSNIHA